MRIAIDAPRGRGGNDAAVARPDEIAAIVAALRATPDDPANPVCAPDATAGARWRYAGRAYDAYDSIATGRTR